MAIRLLRRVFISLTLACVAGSALAGDFFEAGGFALRGYDPVAYFTSGRPTQGSTAYRYQYKGSTFLFATVENQRTFARDPAKYAPQFNGFCALGAANGYKVSTQPNAYAVVDGKLYLNHDTKVLDLWKTDVPGNIAKAEKNWPEVAKSAQKD